MTVKRPLVLSFSGHDPSGGAGIQADIETIVSHRCHPLNIITTLTEQDTQNVNQLIPQNPDHIARQARTILADVAVNAFKIGLLGANDTALAVHSIIQQFPNIPVVFDPVLAAGGGKDLSSTSMIQTIIDQLLPRTTVLTPNSEEARKLAGLEDLTECGLSLLEKGCEYVLITGTHENTSEVRNQLFHDKRCIQSYYWERLPHSYHGSGCTLASSIAALLAQGLSVLDAVAEAQEFTWHALSAGYQPGKGQHVPNRFYWVEGG